MTSLTDDAYVGTLHYKLLDPPVSTASHDLQATCDVGNITTTPIVCDALQATTGDITADLGNLNLTAGDATIFGNIDCVNGLIRTQTGAIVADIGNIAATVGNIIAGNNLQAVAGDIEATAGAVIANGNITSQTGAISATAGNIVALLGNIVATAGDVFASAGNIEATAGNLTAGGNLTQTGTGTFTSGSGANRLNGRINSQAGIDIPLANDAGAQIVQNSIKNNTTFEAQVKFLGQINGTIASPEFCPVFPNAQYKTYTLDTTLPKQEYALSLLATGSAGSLMFDLHTAHGNLRQNYSFEVSSFCADEKPPIVLAPYVLNFAVYPPNNGTSNTDCSIQINYTDYDASQTQVMRVDVRIFYNPSPP